MKISSEQEHHSPCSHRVQVVEAGQRTSKIIVIIITPRIPVLWGKYKQDKVTEERMA